MKNKCALLSEKRLHGIKFYKVQFCTNLKIAKNHHIKLYKAVHTKHILHETKDCKKNIV